MRCLTVRAKSCEGTCGFKVSFDFTGIYKEVRIDSEFILLHKVDFLYWIVYDDILFQD